MIEFLAISEMALKILLPLCAMYLREEAVSALMTKTKIIHQLWKMLKMLYTYSVSSSAKIEFFM